MKYNDVIQEYYENNANVGSLDELDLSVGSSLVGAPACGDVMKLQIKIDKIEGRNIVTDAKIKVFGCGSAKASSSLAVEMLIGKTIEEAKKITNKQIKETLDLPNIKFHCSVLAEEAIQQALEDFEIKNNLKNTVEKNIEDKEDCRIGEKTCTMENLLPKSNQSQDNSKTEEKKESKKLQDNFDFSLEISKEAEDYLSNFLAKQKEQYFGVRIDLEEGSCGLSYKVKGLKSPSDIRNDIIFKYNDIVFFVERKIANIVNKTKMEFKKEGLKAGIFFVNPNEVGRCGCGINFKLEDTKTDESKCNK